MAGPRSNPNDICVHCSCPRWRHTKYSSMGMGGCRKCPPGTCVKFQQHQKVVMAK